MHLASEETKLFERCGVYIQWVDLDVDERFLLGGTHLITDCLGQVFGESNTLGDNGLVPTSDGFSET